MTDFGTKHTILLSFEFIDKLELLDHVSHGDMKKWFAEHDDAYEVTVQNEYIKADQYSFCTTHFTVEGYCRDYTGEVEDKIFTCKMRYNSSSAYAMQMCEVWEIIEENDASDDDDEEEEPNNYGSLCR